MRNMPIYTRQDWHRDKTFAAQPGQEIEPEIYDHMLNALPPLRLPRCPQTDGFIAGFMLGEPWDSDPETGRNRYAAFGLRDRKCFFIGYLTKEYGRK